MSPLDFKKIDKALYLPKKEPVLLEVPEMTFMAVEGKGNPNDSPSYQEAVELLYALTYAIKMSKKGDWVPLGYFDFVVPPLEGLWRLEGLPFEGSVIHRKEDFSWQMLLRQPEFVTQEVFEAAKEVVRKKKPGLDLSRPHLVTFTEGACAQILHLGSYDEEPATIDLLEAFIESNDYRTEMSGMRQHHEIYLSDPRKTALEKLKTLLRHPIVRRS